MIFSIMRVPLPIDAFIPSIAEALKAHASLVVVAQPGSGKTTRIPPALMSHFKGKILVLEPRRVSALAAAQRVAEENNWRVGREVGYQVRFDNRTEPSTQLIFMTEALLTRRMVTDPNLAGVDVIILDEFHERSIHVDLALGLIKEIRELGREIKLVVMSATLQAEEISQYLDHAPIISAPGQLHALELHHSSTTQRLATDFDFFRSLSNLIQSAQRQTTQDILVFLPGVGEIQRAMNQLEVWARGSSVQLCQLHGSLSLDAQRDLLKPSATQRVILATNVAESSLTVPGVDTVIDSGLAKVMRQDRRTGFSRLELVRISLANATQRAGRAARQWPGRCFRMWTIHDERAFAAHEAPEILRVDLAESGLFLAAQGVRNLQAFPWFEKPQDQSLENARKELLALEAIDESGAITAEGRELIALPLPPRLARLMMVARKLGAPQLGADLAAILQERDFLLREHSQNHLGDNLECDLYLRWELLDQFRAGQRVDGVHQQSLKTVLAAAQQLQKWSAGREPANLNPAQMIRRLLLLTYPDRLCRRRSADDRARMVGGRGVKLNVDSLVRRSEFFLALNGIELSGQADSVISLACGLEKDFVLQELKDKIQNIKDVIFDPQRQQFYARKFRSFLGLELDEPTHSNPSPDEIQSQMGTVLTEQFAQILSENVELSRWVDRWRFFCLHLDSARSSVLTDEVILQAMSEAAMGETAIAKIIAKDLRVYFENQFSRDLIQEFHKQVPDRLQVPSGSWLPVQYPGDRPPFLEVRIQEVFGLGATPRILNGSVPLTLFLLGPNYRPVQVTSDLESFWRNGYPEVRKELRARYPKHSWPDNPLTAPAVAKGRSRKT